MAGSKKALHNWKSAQQSRATRAEIVEAFRASPEPGFGVVTGGVSGLIVLDIDPEASGKQSMDELVGRFGHLPLTPVVHTGGGGYHYYFAYPDGGLRNSAGKLGDGLDVRGDAGYVVAPPSVHSSGRSYEWAEERSPDDVGMAQLPQWIIDLLAVPNPTERPSRDGDRVAEGRRHETLVSMAGSMRARGLGATRSSSAKSDRRYTATATILACTICVTAFLLRSASN